METITPIPQTRLKIPDAPPEAAAENPQEGFAQVMARQKKFIQPQENPRGLEREGAGPKIPLAPEEKAKQEGRDPANDPGVTSFLTTPISKAVLPSPPNRPEEPLDLEDPTFFSKLAAQTPHPALASTEQIGSDSPIQPGLDDFPKTNQTGPASAPASVQPAGTLKENPLLSKAFEELILDPAPESLDIERKVSPETTEIATRSSQTTMENSPSFSPQGPAIPETIPILDGPDPSPSLMVRQFATPGRDSEAPALELKSASQTPPSAALSETGKVAPAPIVEGSPISEAGLVESNSQAVKMAATAAAPATSKEVPTLELRSASQAPPSAALSGTGKVAPAPIAEGSPITEAGPVESNSQAVKMAATAAPATSKEVPADRGSSSSAKAEGLPDPKKTSPTLTGRYPETSFLPRASSEVEPGIAPQYSGENPAAPGGPEMNSPIRFQEDTALGVMAKFPDPPRIEGGPADRPVEGPPKGSPDWIKEALSVHQQFSKGLLRTLQQSGDRIQMTLDPPELGSILLEINRNRNFVTAHLWTDNPQTKELLDFSREQLQKTLQLDGFKLDRFEVLVQPDLKSFQEERWFGGRQPDWESNRPGGSRGSSEGLNLSSPETAPLRFSQGNQYVDTWV